LKYITYLSSVIPSPTQEEDLIFFLLNLSLQIRESKHETISSL